MNWFRIICLSARQRARHERGSERARFLFKVASAVLLSFPVACAQIGPRVLSHGRPQYNVAVQETEAQQLLLNIVRQRYSDPVLFLDVTSISSGYYWEATAGLGGTITSGPDAGTANLGGTVSESPLITYSPNNGEKFVRQMLTPLDLKTVALIVQAGWSIERVLLIIGASVNQVRNNMAGSAQDPEFVKYQEVVGALRDLQRAGQLSVGAEAKKTGEDDTGLTLIIDPEAVKSPAYLKVCESIQVACDGQPLRLRQAIGVSSDGLTMALATRSLFSAMYFLAQGVSIPAADAADGVASGSGIAGTGLFGPPGSGDTLFHVFSSATEPERAAVKIFYRGSWFYIADNDRDSKVTFALVSMLVMLQSGDTSKITPLITMPVR